jgi:hypothetical protein
VWLLIVLLFAASAFGECTLIDRFQVDLGATTANYTHKILFDGGDSTLFRSSLSDGADLLFTEFADTTETGLLYHCVAKWDTTQGADSGIGIVYLQYAPAVATIDSVYCYIGCVIADTTLSMCDSVGYGMLIGRDLDTLNSFPAADPIDATCMRRCDDTAYYNIADYPKAASGHLYIEENGNVFIDSTDIAARRYKMLYSGRYGASSATAYFCLMTSPTGLPGSWSFFDDPDSVSTRAGQDPIVMWVDSGWCTPDSGYGDGWLIAGEEKSGIVTTGKDNIGLWFSSEATHCTTLVFSSVIIDSADLVHGLEVGTVGSPAWLPYDFDNDSLFLIVEDGIAEPVRGFSLFGAAKSNPWVWAGIDTLFRGTGIAATQGKGAQVVDQIVILNDTINCFYHAIGDGFTVIAVSRAPVLRDINGAVRAVASIKGLARATDNLKTTQGECTTLMPYQADDSLWYGLANSFDYTGIYEWRLCTYDSTALGDGWVIRSKYDSTQFDGSAMHPSGSVVVEDGVIKTYTSRWVDHNMTAINYVGDSLAPGTCFEMYFREVPIGVASPGISYVNVSHGIGGYCDYLGTVEGTGTTSRWEQAGYTLGYQWDRQTNANRIYGHFKADSVASKFLLSDTLGLQNYSLLTFALSPADSLLFFQNSVRNSTEFGNIKPVTTEWWVDRSGNAADTLREWAILDGNYQGNRTSVFDIEFIAVRNWKGFPYEIAGSPHALEEGTHSYVVLCEVPAQVTGVLTASDGTYIYLSWTAVADADSYCVYVDDSAVDTLTAVTFTYLPGDVVAHDFEISAYSDCGEGAKSAVVSRRATASGNEVVMGSARLGFNRSPFGR